MDSFRRRRLLEKTSQYEQVLITTTDLEQVTGFFGATANYFYVANGQVRLSDQYGDVVDSPVPGRGSNGEAGQAIDESA